MKDEYIIINKTNILKRIEHLELLKRIHCYAGKFPNERQFQTYNDEQRILKQILSQSISLIPEIEKAYFEGECYGIGRDASITKQNYISNLKLNI